MSKSGYIAGPMRGHQEYNYPASCYIAGPMRGHPAYNYPAFNAMAEELRDLGWTVYNPAEMDATYDKEDYSARSLEEQALHNTAEAARHFARRDVRILLEVLKAENGDGIVLLPGWETSIGARAEKAVAEWAMLRVFRAQELVLGTKDAE